MRRLVFAAACLVLMLAPALAHDVDLTRLPLGDGKLAQGPQVGWIWPCHVDAGGGGAFRDGPWIDSQAGTFDLTAKAAVGGSVMWQNQFTIVLDGSNRILVTNGLPNHPTGIFPISPNDPAFQYDRNPNSIMSQNMRIVLPANPVMAAQPSCAPGVVGILLNGVALFSALDAPGRDALAHETQDGCRGHPQPSGIYHYHSLTDCIDDRPEADGNSPLVGYAIDGFGIYGSYADGVRLSSVDLDGCHGRTSVVEWDGRKVEMYHYVATPDFPYTVGCIVGLYDRTIVRMIGGGPPRMGPGGGQGFGPPQFGPPPRGGVPFGGPPPPFRPN